MTWPTQWSRSDHETTITREPFDPGLSPPPLSPPPSDAMYGTAIYGSSVYAPSAPSAVLPQTIPFAL